MISYREFIDENIKIKKILEQVIDDDHVITLNSHWFNSKPAIRIKLFYKQEDFVEKTENLIGDKYILHYKEELIYYIVKRKL